MHCVSFLFPPQQLSARVWLLKLQALKCAEMHFPFLHQAIRFRMACTKAVGRCCIADPTIYLCASLVLNVSRRSAPSRLMCIHAAVTDPDEGAAWSTLVAETQLSVLRALKHKYGLFHLDLGPGSYVDPYESDCIPLWGY